MSCRHSLVALAGALLVAAGAPSGPAAPSAPAQGPASPAVPVLPGSPAARGTTEAPDARELLARAEERYRELESLKASFRQTVEVPLLDRRRSGHGTWYQKGPGRFKMEFADPPRDVIVADGTHLWLYYPSSHPGQVVRTAVEGHRTGTEMVDLQGRIFREASRGYEAEYAGSEEVAGVRTHQLVLTPTGESPYRKVRVWVGAEDLLVRKFEITEENETVRTVVLSDLEPNAAVPDSTFGFDVPEGVEVFSG